MALRLTLLFLIALSIGIIYYDTVVLNNFEVLENPDGPDTSDYFETEE